MIYIHSLQSFINLIIHRLNQNVYFQKKEKNAFFHNKSTLLFESFYSNQMQVKFAAALPDMAGHKMPRRPLDQRWFHLTALRFSVWTSCMETTTARNIHRARQITFDDLAL